MLLLLILLMTLQVVNLQLAADIYPCSDETKWRILHFPEYTQVEICCQLVGDWCNKMTSNDTLSLAPKTGCNGSCDSQTHREDVCLVKFEISNASSADEGNYVCSLNGEALRNEPVHIIKKPPTPVIISFTCSYNNERTVTFDRGPQSTDVYNDTYNITMVEERTSPVMICDTTQLLCKPGDRVCVCKIKLSGTVNPSNTVAIYVTVNRSVQTSWASRNFTIAGNIIPGPIMLLNVSQVSPHNAQIKFCMHADTRRLCSFMSSRGAPLRFHLLVYREQGTPEILNVTLPTSDKVYCDLCRLVQLPNLIAYTNYTVIASNSGGGGESNKSRVEFTTKETAPVYPPVVDDFGFRRLDNCSVSGRPQPCLIVIWKPLPHEVKGGSKLSYYMEVISQDGFQIDQTTVDAHAVISHQSLPPGPLTVKLWSQNVIGRTQNYTRFDIPSKSEAAAPYVLVELNGDDAFVYVNLTSQTDVPLVVQWCNSYLNKSKSYFNLCQDYPSVAAFIVTAATNKSFQKFEVQFSTNMELKEIQYYQPITYYELSYFNSNPKIANNATATVTKNAYQIIQDMHYYFDEEVYDPVDDSIYFNISRKRRYVLESISSSEAKKKFSISFKKQDMPNTGMLPANCYYDAAKEKVSLTTSQFQDSSSNAVILQWVQTCETDIPQQFVAEYFHVYSSTNEHCTENKIYINRINNTLFQPKVLKLPSNTKFACIQTFRSDGFQAADLEIHPVTPYTDANTKETTGVPVNVIVPVILAVVFLSLSGVIIWKCIKQKQHVDKLADKTIVLPTESTLEAPTHGMICSSVSNVPEQTVSEQVDAISSNSSGDSGRGTDNNSKPVNCDDTSYGDNSISSSGGSTNHRSSDKSPEFTVDLSGSGVRQDNEALETDCSRDDSHEENVCSDSYHEENENDGSGTAGDRVCESGQSQQSYTDSDQQEVLQERGFTFNCNNNSGSSNSSNSSEFPATNDKNISSSSSSSAKSSENAHSSNCFSEPSGGNSCRKANSSSSITEDIGNSDIEEENTSYSVGSNGSDRGRDQQCETSFHSNNGSRSFKHSESAGCFGHNFENHIPSDAECSLTFPLNRCISSGSESEGDVEKPFIHDSEVHV
ncbi:hypothetical protein BsWGS_23510 [Bradybaena similaris]